MNSRNVIERLHTKHALDNSCQVGHMFEGKFCATAVLNILSNEWTFSLCDIWARNLSSLYKINVKLIQCLDLLSLVYIFVPNVVLAFGNDVVKQLLYAHF